MFILHQILLNLWFCFLLIFFAANMADGFEQRKKNGIKVKHAKFMLFENEFEQIVCISVGVHQEFRWPESRNVEFDIDIWMGIENSSWSTTKGFKKSKSIYWNVISSDFECEQRMIEGEWVKKFWNNKLQRMFNIIRYHVKHCVSVP